MPNNIDSNNIAPINSGRGSELVTGIETQLPVLKLKQSNNERVKAQIPSTSRMSGEIPSSVNVSATGNVFRFQLNGEDKVITSFEELLSYDTLVEKITQSHEYMTYDGQSIKNIKTDILENEALQKTLLSVNNIQMTPVQIEPQDIERREEISKIPPEKRQKGFVRKFMNFFKSKEQKDIDEAKDRLKYMPNISKEYYSSLGVLEKELRNKKILHNGEYKFILNKLIEKPELIEEVIAIIEDILPRNCRTQVDVVCNMIKVRFITASILENVCYTHGSLDWFSLLYKAKLLFHETMLVDVLTELNLFDVHQRAEFKYYLSSKVCQFPANDIKGIGSFLYTRDTSKDALCLNTFNKKIWNKDGFKKYLHGMCQDDKFLSFIKQNDEDLGVNIALVNSEYYAELDKVMEHGANKEQYIILKSRELLERRETALSNAIKSHINKKVNLNWVELNRETIYSS